MKHSCRNFSFIAAVLGLLTIFPHQSEADAASANWGSQLMQGMVLGGQSSYFRNELSISNDYLERQLPLSIYTNVQAEWFQATGEEEDATPSSLLHIDLQELFSLNYCKGGCTAAFALIPSTQCNSTDAQDSALEFKLEKELTFDIMTDMKKDEDAPDKDWVTKPFRELIDKSSDNITADSSPPISMAEFVVYKYTTAAMAAGEFIPEDYNLAVYLYNNNETDPLACATLDLVTGQDELQDYYAFFGGWGEGDEGPGIVEVGPVGNGSSPLSGGLLAYAVAVVSIVLSAILFAT
jgi:hypothetical protein